MQKCKIVIVNYAFEEFFKYPSNEKLKVDVQYFCNSPVFNILKCCVFYKKNNETT